LLIRNAYVAQLPFNAVLNNRRNEHCKVMSQHTEASPWTRNKRRKLRKGNTDACSNLWIL